MNLIINHYTIRNVSQLRTHKLKQLRDTTRDSIETENTLTKLEDGIHNGKVNKAPGPDGVSNEFIKYSIEEVKCWILRYLEHLSTLL